MDANLEMLCKVADALGDLREEVVFVGGAVVNLLLTDPAAVATRPTDDVDVIIEIGGEAERVALRERLVRQGFGEDSSEDAPICRWTTRGIKVDVMPTDSSILGFSNRWYRDALRNAKRATPPGCSPIWVITAPYFVATKIEAFRGRGGGDYLASHDIEDLIVVVDGRQELVDEIDAAPADLRDYVSEAIGELLQDEDFLDALPGHLAGDSASQGRLGVIKGRLGRIGGTVAG